MKGARGGGEVLVVSFRGVNYGLYYHIRCSGRNRSGIQDI